MKLAEEILLFTTDEYLCHLKIEEIRLKSALDTDSTNYKMGVISGIAFGASMIVQMFGYWWIVPFYVVALAVLICCTRDRYQGIKNTKIKIKGLEIEIDKKIRELKGIPEYITKWSKRLRNKSKV